MARGMALGASPGADAELDEFFSFVSVECDSVPKGCFHGNVSAPVGVGIVTSRGVVRATHGGAYGCAGKGGALV